MNPEIWDLYDKDRQKTGETMVRGEEIPAGRYHLVVHVWLRNSRGEYLLGRRAADRPTHPLMWECPGGSVVRGEDSLSGAIREAFEEVGVPLRPENARLLFSRLREKDAFTGKKYGDILDCWLFDYDGGIDLAAATTREVCEAKWVSLDQMRALMDAGKMVSSLEYIFCMESGTGSRGGEI